MTVGPLITIEAAAAELGVPVRALRRVAEDHGFVVRMGRAIRLDRGQMTVPEWLASDLRGLLEQFPGGIREVDPRRSIDVLHQHMIAAGRTADQSAAAILGAAHALAVRVGGPDAARG